MENKDDTLREMKPDRNWNKCSESTCRDKKTGFTLTCHTQRGGAFITAVLIGCLAGIFPAVIFSRAQNLQRGSSEATDYPVFIPFFNRVSIFEPLEVHVWSLCSVTFKPGLVANIDLQRSNFVFEHRLHCVTEEKDKKMQ